MVAMLPSHQPPVDYMAGDKIPRTPAEITTFDAALDDKRVPTVSDVEGAERVLAGFRCIGPMRQWHRVFSFGRNANTFKLDPSLIAFTFTEAGRFGRRSDRRITTCADRSTGSTIVSSGWPTASIPSAPISRP